MNQSFSVLGCLHAPTYCMRAGSCQRQSRTITCRHWHRPLWASSSFQVYLAMFSQAPEA